MSRVVSGSPCDVCRYPLGDRDGRVVCPRCGNHPNLDAPESYSEPWPDVRPRDPDDAMAIDQRWRQWARRYLPAHLCTTSDAMRDALSVVLDAVRRQGSDLDDWRRWGETVVGATRPMSDADLRLALSRHDWERDEENGR